MFDRSAKTQYFEFKPAAGHMPGCARYGTAVFEVARLRRDWSVLDSSGARDETTIRIICVECGVAVFETFVGSSFEGTSTDKAGYGMRPEKIGGLWAHAGPRLLYSDEHGPQAYYLTAGRERPTEPAHVVGSVAWHLTRRGAVRWSAAYGLTAEGNAAQVADAEFASRRAAVRWVVEQLAAADRQAGDGRAES